MQQIITKEGILAQHGYLVHEDDEGKMFTVFLGSFPLEYSITGDSRAELINKAYTHLMVELGE